MSKLRITGLIGAATTGALAITATLVSCGLIGDDSSIPASMKFVSTSLSSASSTTARASSSSQLPSSHASVSTTDCGSATACMTPTNVKGMVYYTGMMVGTQQGYSLGLYGPKEGSSGLTEFKTDGLKEFDLAEKLSIAGEGMTCCGGSSYPEDSDAYVTRMEVFFAYLDVTVEFAEGEIATALVGSHTIRIVYGNYPELGYTKGDLLYKDSTDSTFKWCDDTSCTHTTRPTSPKVNSYISTYSGSSDGLGSQVVPSFAAQLASGATRLQMTQSEVEGNSWAFVIDFDMTNGVIFDVALTEIQTVMDLVSHFDLSARPGLSDGGFTFTVEATKTPL